MKIEEYLRSMGERELPHTISLDPGHDAHTGEESPATGLTFLPGIQIPTVVEPLENS